MSGADREGSSPPGELPDLTPEQAKRMERRFLAALDQRHRGHERRRTVALTASVALVLGMVAAGATVGPALVARYRTPPAEADADAPKPKPAPKPKLAPHDGTPRARELPRLGDHSVDAGAP